MDLDYGWVILTEGSRKYRLTHPCGINLTVDHSQVRLQSECCSVDLWRRAPQLAIRKGRLERLSKSQLLCVKCSAPTPFDESFKSGINHKEWESASAIQWLKYYGFNFTEVIVEQGLLELRVNRLIQSLKE